MKAKVFKYKSDGNTVVASYMELEPYAKNVYLSLSRKNEYGNEDDDCFHVVCRIENVYFSSGQYSRGCSMNRNGNSWTGNGSREKCSLKSPEGTVLTSISEPKGHSIGM